MTSFARTTSEKQALREKLAKDTNDYLNAGGEISHYNMTGEKIGVTRKKKINRVTHILKKTTVQDMIKALRKAGLKVEKTVSGYNCDVQGRSVFKAILGYNNYVVTMADDLFQS